MNRVLVTGASGFIGTHLVPRLHADGYDVVEVRRAAGDVAVAATWSAFPPADVVVHLAGESFVPESWRVPAEFIRTNLLGTVQALDYCRSHGAHLVFPSSYLYGTAVRQPIPETAALSPGSPYALSKKFAEDACAFYAERFDVTTTVLRPFNIYGSGQSAAFLVPTILAQVYEGREIHVKDLDPRRDYVYIADVIDAIVRAIGWRRSLSVLNIGSGTSCSVADLIATIQDIWGTRLPVRSDGERRKDEIMDTVADVAEARRLLGWTPRFTLRQGLQQMHDAR